MKTRRVFLVVVFFSVVLAVGILVWFAAAQQSDSGKMGVWLARLADVFAQLRWWLTGFRAAVVALLIWRWPALVYWVYPEALAGFEQKRSALMGWRYKVLIGFVAVELLLVHNVLAMLTKGIL